MRAVLVYIVLHERIGSMSMRNSSGRESQTGGGCENYGRAVQHFVLWDCIPFFLASGNVAIKVS